jgi:hypothetical protein
MSRLKGHCVVDFKNLAKGATLRFVCYQCRLVAINRISEGNRESKKDVK